MDSFIQDRNQKKFDSFNKNVSSLKKSGNFPELGAGIGKIAIIAGIGLGAVLLLK